MAELPTWVWGAAGAGVIVLILVVARRLEGRRSEALEQAALRLGLAFEAKGGEPGPDGFGGLPLFQRGRSRRLKNVARGGSEQFFGYSYTTGSGQSSTTHVQTVAVIESSTRRLPHFELKPEGLFDRLGSVLGGQDIDFADDPAFSRAYRLKGPEETAIRETFHSGLRQHLANESGWSIEGEGRWLVLYRRSKRIKPDELADFIESARRISSLFH